MKISAHVAYTWLLAVLIHPILWVLIGLITTSREIDWRSYLSWEMVFFFVFLFFLAIPSFLFSWLLIYPILRTNYTLLEKLFLWSILVIIAIVCNYLLFYLVLSGNNFSVDFDDLKLCLPAIVSALISISVRYNYFFKLFSH
jgi:hypothetical protein